jgi:hypothetical protein
MRCADVQPRKTSFACSTALRVHYGIDYPHKLPTYMANDVVNECRGSGEPSTGHLLSWLSRLFLATAGASGIRAT